MSVTVITGPPCSGKTTYVDEHRGDSDLVLDFDRLAQALGSPDEHPPWDSEHPAVVVARGLRSHVLNFILDNRHTINAWVVDTDPPAFMLKRYRAAGVEVITIDPGEKVCLARAKADRPRETRDRIREWYAGR